jgi:hypothetical protein
MSISTRTCAIPRDEETSEGGWQIGQLNDDGIAAIRAWTLHRQTHFRVLAMVITNGDKVGCMRLESNEVQRKQSM